LSYARLAAREDCTLPGPGPSRWVQTRA